MVLMHTRCTWHFIKKIEFGSSSHGSYRGQRDRLQVVVEDVPEYPKYGRSGRREENNVARVSALGGENRIV